MKYFFKFLILFILEIKFINLFINESTLFLNYKYIIIIRNTGVYWDTAGQERFRAAAIKTIRFIQEIIIVFQLTDRKSFEDVNDFLQTIKENWSNPKIVLFGNKIDIDKKEWKVTSEEAKEFAKKHNLPYFEMSAKTRQGLNEGFSYAIEEAYHMAEEELNKNKIIIPNNNNNNNNSVCPGNKKKKK